MSNDPFPLTAPGAPAPAAAPRLRVNHLVGSLAGRVVDLDPGGAYRVGRHPECQVRYDHTVDFLVSTRHGQLAVEDGAWVFTDTNSTNGSYVNGVRVHRHVLASGQVVVLGTPNAAGSATFAVEVAPVGAAPAGADGPFAQEPADSSEFVQFPCQHCGATNTAVGAHAGQMIACAACGRPTAVVVPPGYRAPAAAAGPAVQPYAPTASSYSPGYAQPASGQPAAPGLQPVQPRPPVAGGAGQQPGGFLGGIVSGVKGKIDRMRERGELKREIAGFEAQLPQLETAARQACTTAGQDLWRQAAGPLKAFRSAGALEKADDAVRQVEERVAAADRDGTAAAQAHAEWTDGWQERHAVAERELADAEQALADAKQSQQRAKDAVTAAWAPRVDAMAFIQQKLAALASEARQDPPDDLWPRYQSAIAELNERQAELATEVPGLADLVAARSAAAEAVTAAAERREAAVTTVEQSKAERAQHDAARADAERQHQQAVAALRAEADQIRAPLAAYHMDLGRQYIDTPDAPAVDPLPASVGAARQAVQAWGQAYAALGQRKQRLAELDAGGQ
ncbi:MAG TPA: FHA domain-containing protein [Humisphaera sp.]